MQSSPGTPPLQLALRSKENIAAAVRALGLAYGDYATKIIEQDVDGLCLFVLLESGAGVFNQFLAQLGVSLVAHQARLQQLFMSMRSSVDDDTHERALWLKACLILEECTKGIRPYVSNVMQHLHRRVIENVKQDVMRDLGTCDDEDWDCSYCGDAEDAKFTENSPVILTICSMNKDGIADCGAAHHLKPHVMTPCRLRNIPDRCFSDSYEFSSALPLLICPNPADISKPDSSTFLLLRCLQSIPTEPHLTPFRFTRCDPSEPPLKVTHAVLCSSCPGHTARLVRSFLLQQPLPSHHANALGEIPTLSFGFWSLFSLGSEFIEQKHSIKNGHILCFEDAKDNSLPPGITPGCRYLVTNATDFSFTICGPIVSPSLPLTRESYPLNDAPLVVIRRSPIGRIRDAARLFHSRSQPSVHWSGIRTGRLSSHYGEFCKLFCSQTCRQVDFFLEGSAQSAEQLLNMIGMCTAFSIDQQCLPIDVQHGMPLKVFQCTVHSSPPVLLSVVASAHNPSHKPTQSAGPQPSKVQPIRLWTGSMNEAGVWTCDGRKLQADVQVSFSDAGCGVPSHIHAGCRYLPACIEVGSFQVLRPNFCSLFDIECSGINDLKLALNQVRKGAVGQPISQNLKHMLNLDSGNHAALKLALEGVQKDPVVCNISKYLINLMSVDPENHEALMLALDKVKTVLVGQQVSDLREPGVKDFRNKLCHNLLTLETQQFDVLVACARSMFQGVVGVNAFMDKSGQDSDYAEASLAEIERIVARESNFQGLVSTLSDHERNMLVQLREQMLQERELREQMLEERDQLKVKLGRKFDSFAPCLKKDIENQLIPKNLRARSGGQGSVYEVKHWIWGQALAVKMFHYNQAGNAWRRELNSLTFLTHANIVRMMYIVYETLEDRSQCRAPVGYAMELMALSAADWHDYTFEQLMKVLLQIAGALVFSHEQGVIHFDVKPENILLNESCSVAKLCDFGCSHKLQSAAASITSSSVQGQVRGTLLYMAPEAFQGKLKDSPLNVRCDIYSFGKTMWKLLHPDRSVEINRSLPVDAAVPAALKLLVEECTMDDADKRPQKMSDVWLRLQLVLQDYQTSMDSASATSSSALQVNSSPSFIVSHVAFIFAAHKSVTIPDTPQVACRTSHFISRTSQVTDVQMNIEPGQNSELFLNPVEVHRRFMDTAPAPAAQAVFGDSGGSFSALGAEGPTAEANAPAAARIARQGSIFKAAEMGNMDLVKDLVIADPSCLHMKNASACTPLHRASFRGHLQVCQFLVESKADLFAKDNLGLSPLHHCSQEGFAEVCQFLIASKADIHSETFDSLTPLHLSSGCGHIHVCELLVANGADLHSKNRRGSTPLHVASDYGHIQICRFLLESSADLQAQDNGGNTPLHRSAHDGREEVCRLLLDFKADLHAKCGGGSTPLHQGSFNGHVQVCHALVEMKADLQSTDVDGDTPLHCASWNNRIEACQFLLTCKANLNSTNFGDDTPLHHSSKNGHIQVCQLLVESKADVTARNSAGNTPVREAICRRRDEVAAYLGSMGAPQ